MNTTTENFTQETHTRNKSLKASFTNYRPSTLTPELATTLFREVSPRNEITITLAQFKLASWLYQQYGMVKPGWLRRKFLLNQRRVKSLNDVLTESGLDGSWCGTACVEKGWSCKLHDVWHKINGVSSCN